MACRVKAGWRLPGRHHAYEAPLDRNSTVEPVGLT